MIACGGRKTVDKETVMQQIQEKYEAIMADTLLTDEEMMSRTKELIMESYVAHSKDSVGLEMFGALVRFEDPEKVIELYESSDIMIRENEVIMKEIMALRKQAETGVGKQYIEIAGPDAMTGQNLSLKEMLAQGKPVLVDFFASWCGPCRQEIKEHLKAIAADGKVSILSVAVGEKRIEDTRAVITDLEMTWPVIYSCDLEEKPAENYGIISIPTLLLISPDGTILARDYTTENFASLLEGI